MNIKNRILTVMRSEQCKEILRSYKVKKTALFGSYANGKNTKGSDIDLLVDFESGADLFDQVGLKMELEKLLKKKVDVVTRGGLSKYFKDSVQSSWDPAHAHRHASRIRRRCTGNQNDGAGEPG